MPVIANNLNEVRIKVDADEQFKLVGIKNNMLVKSIEEKKIGEQKLLLFKCDLLTTYMKDEEKPLSQFLVGEDILYGGDEKMLSAILEEWTKNKKLLKAHEDEIIQGLNTICMYDMQFFTNKMRFPPCTGFNINVSSEADKKQKIQKK